MVRTRRMARGMALCAAAALAVSACTSDGDGGSTAGTTGGTAASGAPRGATVTREQVEASLGSMDGIVTDAMDALGTPGIAVAVVYGDEVMLTEGYGVRSTETGEPVDEETIFEIASLSKSVSGTIVSGLVSRGDLAWDDPVQEANPDFALADPWVSEHLTYADLVSMRAGLPGQAGNLLESIGYDRDTILERLRLVENLNPFRDSYEYSNFSLTAGGVLAARAAGMSWEEAADDVLFGPAGMTSSSYAYADYEAAQNRAELHVPVDGGFEPLFTRMPDAQAPAGGVNTNIVDLATWARIVLNEGMLGDEQIVDPEVFAEMVTPASKFSAPTPPTWYSSAYGMGINVGLDADGNARWNHSGAFSTGTSTAAVFLPGQDVAVIVITNGAPVGAPEAITDAYLDVLLHGAQTRDWNALWGERMQAVYGEPEDIGTAPADPTPPREAAAYVGTYANEYVGEFEIVETDTGGLAIVEGPARVTYELTPFDADTFTYAHAPELPDYLSTVTFTVGADGTATAMDVSVWDEFGWGELQRV